MNMQKGINSCGFKGKESVMKKIRNLAGKNDCFGEIDIESLTEGNEKKSFSTVDVYGDETEW